MVATQAKRKHTPIVKINCMRIVEPKAICTAILKELKGKQCSTHEAQAEIESLFVSDKGSKAPIAYVPFITYPIVISGSRIA